tara:strand:+ start:497 stop:1186 length:690 start_codon:yes stop_codon:yes gene_type:complete
MKKIAFFTLLNLCLTTVSQGQTYSSNYTVIKATQFIQTDKIISNDSTNLQLLKDIDTTQIKNNNQAVLVGTMNAISNDSISILKFKVRKSSVPSYVPIGKTITCLIDYNNNLIYDVSSSSIMPFKTPSPDSMLVKNRINSIEVSDSVHKIEYNWKDNVIEVITEKRIPAQVRGTFLMTSNSYGVSFFRTQNQQIELNSFEITNEDFTNEIESIKSKCKKNGSEKTLIFL